MNTKTMEGLAGASASMSLISTPMNVAKEAERKGDTDKMKRALGYAAGMKEQADEYGQKASQGMKLDAKEVKEQEKLRQEELIETRREEQKAQREQTEERTGKTADSGFDSVKISEEGKALSQEAAQMPAGSIEGTIEGTDDVTYDQTGGYVETAEAAGENVDVSV